MNKEWYSKKDLTDLDNLLKLFGLSVEDTDFGDFDYLEKHLGEFYDSVFNNAVDNSNQKNEVLKVNEGILYDSAIKLLTIQDLYWNEPKEIKTKIKGCDCKAFFP